MGELDRAVTRMVFENYGAGKYYDDHKEPKKTGIDVYNLRFNLHSIKEGVTNIPEELVDKDHPLRFKPLNHLEFFFLSF